MKRPAFHTTCKIGVWFDQPFWMTKVPSLEELKADFSGIMTEEVFQEQVSDGVTIRVRLDGLWELDLSGIPSCASVRIPELDNTSEVGLRFIPEDYYRASETATERLRSQIQFANAFKACFTAAMQCKQANYFPLDAPETPSDYLPLEEGAFHHFGTDLNPNNRLFPQNRNRIRGASEAFVSVFTKHATPERTFVNNDTLKYSGQLFAEIIGRGENFELLVDLLYHQHYLYSCHRFSESLLGAWSITETALFRQWKTYLEKCKSAGNPIARKRMENKLNDGRSFTASVVQEVLNLAGELSNEEYEQLEAIRKARNSWVHNLVPVTDRQTTQALTLCRAMVKKSHGLDFGLSISLQTAHGPQ